MMLCVWTADLPSLLATMLCQHKGEQCTAATWKFSTKSSVFLMFNAINRKWTITDSRATRIKEKWEKDQDLMEFFRKISLGDCIYWLRQFSELLEKAPGKPLGSRRCQSRVGRSCWLSVQGQ